MLILIGTKLNTNSVLYAIFPHFVSNKPESTAAVKFIRIISLRLQMRYKNRVCFEDSSVNMPFYGLIFFLHSVLLVLSH
jgi:hypothetical protein